MKAFGFVLLAIVGAGITMYAWTTPGDQIAIAALGGAFIGWGIVGSALS